MKIILLLTLTALMGTGCVVTPDGNFSGGVLFDGGATVGVDVDYAPRVYNGTRSGVTVWLHPSHIVADAYPIAQEHCARWGFFAQPSFNWTATATFERRLNYSCIGHRPVLSGPHIIIGSPFYRNHYRHWHNTNRRRPYYGRNTYNGRRHDRGYNNRVYTPKPVPRHRPNYQAPARRRGTFGRIFSPKETTVQRGKPWEHNRNKNRGISLPTRPDTTVQRGKPWEHNRNKNKGTVAPRLELPQANKRKTFGRFKPAKVYKSPNFKRKDFRKKKATTYKTKSFGKIRPKKTNRRVNKGPLTL